MSACNGWHTYTICDRMRTLHVKASGTKCMCMASCRISCQAGCQLPAAARQVGACAMWEKVNTEMQDYMMDHTPPGGSPWQLSRDAGFWVARPPSPNLALRQAAIKQALLMGTLHPASLERHTPLKLAISVEPQQQAKQLQTTIRFAM